MKRCHYIGGGQYQISWSFSRNIFRHNRSATITNSRIVDEDRAKLFCKKWGLTFVAEGKATG